MTDLVGPVHVVGAGLLGTSVGLAAQRAGLEVWLSDANHEHVRTASGLGAGRAAPDDGAAQLTVVAVPPDHIAEAVVEALERGGVVTDVGSVKGLPLDQVADHADEDLLARYVGSHPMAGSERSGPLAATAALFDGRPWAITPHVHSAPEAVDLVEALAQLCGAQPVRLSPVEHDLAVARTSHLPHLLAVLTAGQLAEALPEHLSLSGQGVRDVTRIAAGDPDMWGQIIRANRAAVTELLGDVRADLDRLMEVLATEDEETLEEILTRGVNGTQAIPGKHGGPAIATASVFVSVPDHPGELARLFADVGEIGVNIADLHIDHDPGRPVGLVELVVEDTSAEGLRADLETREWVTHR
ncbi:MAG: prephenate dehydrogenase [Marmoricola sp.]